MNHLCLNVPFAVCSSGLYVLSRECAGDGKAFTQKFVDEPSQELSICLQTRWFKWSSVDVMCICCLHQRGHLALQRM